MDFVWAMDHKQQSLILLVLLLYQTGHSTKIITASFFLNMILMIHTKLDNFISDNMEQSCYYRNQVSVAKDKNIPDLAT